MNKPLFLSILLSSLIINEATAFSDFTLIIHREAKAADRQYCYTDFEIDLEGHWTSKTKYSNGHQLDGVRFYSVITIMTKDNREVVSIPQNHHVKPSLGGKAREETTIASGKLPKDVTTMITKKEAGYSCRKVSDIDFKKLQQAVEVAKWVLEL